MDKRKRNFKEQLEKYQNKKIDLILGKIDIETILTNDINSLLYIFPLMEKIIATICSYQDIEQYNQGTMRTINSIISKNITFFDDRTTNLIKKYFGEKGVRNKVMHCSESTNIPYNKEEILGLLYLLLEQLKSSLDVDDFKDIEKL